MESSTMNYKQGDRVVVFQDPITRKVPEGLAVTVGRKSQATTEDGAIRREWWGVRFDGDDASYLRWI